MECAVVKLGLTGLRIALEAVVQNYTAKDPDGRLSEIFSAFSGAMFESSTSILRHGSPPCAGTLSITTSPPKPSIKKLKSDCKKTGRSIQSLEGRVRSFNKRAKHNTQRLNNLGFYINNRMNKGAAVLKKYVDDAEVNRAFSGVERKVQDIISTLTSQMVWVLQSGASLGNESSVHAAIW
ncbi:hypothetical protein K469DRAFT_688652 [Zopfia rhizophila CBS 207.26]|uniref:Uncharacterized protein n=1 Tax=Zopfia rhizophila CBS 207.26 TaxID=1314779 RepID=A0A6A6E440_9PEZI|nr:hypothetical protein K469DRAFT_688652 [Zopfia rhizophila CBS 207.26]